MDAGERSNHIPPGFSRRFDRIYGLSGDRISYFTIFGCRFFRFGRYPVHPRLPRTHPPVLQFPWFPACAPGIPAASHLQKHQLQKHQLQKHHLQKPHLQKPLSLLLIPDSKIIPGPRLPGSLTPTLPSPNPRGFPDSQSNGSRTPAAGVNFLSIFAY